MSVPFTYALMGYHGLLRGVVEILEIFPPKRVNKEEANLRKGGFCPSTPIADGCIWVHGASLGEIITLRPFLTLLAQRFGRDKILATSTTFDGVTRLRKDGLVDHITFLPIEIPELVEPFLDRMKPRLVLISETEIWPLLFAILARRKIPFGIINARINQKTVKCLKLFFSLFQNAVNGISFVFAQNTLYARRFANLGVPKDRINIVRSFKYDIAEPTLGISELRERFGIPPGRQVLCFGSTRPGEEKIILEALEPLWSQISATIVLAPRHPERISEVEKLLLESHIDYSRLRSRKNPVGRILLVDTLGELQNFYSISSLAFVGGSLVNLGGHNVMEPAACGVPIISGPHTNNFTSEVKALKQEKALIEVADQKELSVVIQQFINSPDSFKSYGIKAREVSRRMSGNSKRTLLMLEKFGLLPKWP